jgi:hypothetical protein
MMFRKKGFILTAHDVDVNADYMITDYQPRIDAVGQKLDAIRSYL